MNNELQIFENKEFGEVRVLNINNEPWFVAKDVAEKLGYGNPRQGIASHVDDEDKGVQKLDTPSGTQNMTIINESGLYSLIFSSKLSTAKAFKHWVTHDVLPAIRKTGSYSAKPADNLKAERLAVMKRNAKVREANLWAKLAQGGNETFKQVCRTYAANILAEKEVIALPEVSEKTYTATEIGTLLGISANKVGRLAVSHNLKTEKYGKWYHDKSRYSSKEVESFRYYENAIDEFKSILKAGDNHVAG